METSVLNDAQVFTDADEGVRLFCLVEHAYAQPTFASEFELALFGTTGNEKPIT